MQRPPLPQDHHYGVGPPHPHSGLSGVRVRRVGEKRRVRGGPSLGAKMARGFDRTSHGSSLFLFVKIHHHCVTDCFRPYESLIRSEALIFLTLGTCTVQLCCQFIWYGKTLKNSLLTLLYNKLTGPDLSLFNYVRLPEFAPISRSPGQPPP